MKEVFLLAVLLIFTVLSASAMDSGYPARLLAQWGISDYKPGNSVVATNVTFSTKRVVGKFDNDPGNGTDSSVDTSAEAVTGLFFDYAVEIDLLPHNYDGVIDVCAMWMKRIAENPEGQESYNNAIDYVLEKSNVLWGEKDPRIATLNDAVITEYYVDSMRATIETTELRLLSPDEKTNDRELLLSYFANPTDVNAIAFKSFYRSLNEHDPEKGSALIKCVNTVSPEVCNKIV